MGSLRVALFVEGSEGPPAARKPSALQRIWNDDLARSVDIPAFDVVVPISKKHLVAMDPDNPPMSGAGESLDQLMVRMMRREPFDAAVVAWDLVPAWNPTGSQCRWRETLDFYRLLSVSECLPALWKQRAGKRWRELDGRASPGERERPPRLVRGMALALCMEPMFEGLLVQDEAALKRALGVQGKPLTRWPPAKRWKNRGRHDPDRKLIGPAVSAARNVKPQPRKLRPVRGSWLTNKDGWGEFLLRELLADEQARPTVLAHPLCRRLAEVGARR